MSKVWMPLYIGDYLADTAHLDAAEHGAYLLLMMHYWRNGPLPKVHKQLQQIAHLNGRGSLQILRTVLAFFDEHEDAYYHKRIDEERQKAADNKEVQRKRTEAARAKLQEKRKSVTETVTKSPSPSPSPVPTVLKTPLPPSGGVEEAKRIYSEATDGLDLPKPILTDKTKRNLEVTLKRYGLNAWREACDKIRGSPHLRGENDRGWHVTFGWLAEKAKFEKVIEGRYDGRNNNRSRAEEPHNRQLETSRESLAEAFGDGIRPDGH